MTVHRRKKKATGRAALLLAMLLATALAAAACAGPEQRDETSSAAALKTTAPPAETTTGPLPAAAPVEVSFEAESNTRILPEVQDYAVSVTEQEMDRLAGRYGLRFSAAEVTALECVDTNTYRLRMWQMEYRLLPIDAAGSALPEEVKTEDGWVIGRSGCGQPLLLMLYNEETMLYEPIAVSDTETVAREFGGDYTRAADELYYRWQGVKPAEPDMLAELFAVGGCIDIGLSVPGKDREYPVYSSTDFNFYGFLVSCCEWTPVEPDEAMKTLWQTAPYCVSLAASDGSIRFTFFGGGDTAVYQANGEETWYTLKYVADNALLRPLAADLRYEYDCLSVTAESSDFAFDGGAEAAAEHFVREAYAERLLARAPGGLFSVKNYQVIEWAVDQVSEDGTAVTGSFRCALEPEFYDSFVFRAGSVNAMDGTDEYEGWLLMTYTFVLQEQGGGLWRCLDIGTERMSLPEPGGET